MGLGGSHYNFIKEIPLYADYEIRVNVVGWEEKWMYVVAQFVTYPKKKRSLLSKLIPRMDKTGFTTGPLATSTPNGRSALDSKLDGLSKKSRQDASISDDQSDIEPSDFNMNSSDEDEAHSTAPTSISSSQTIKRSALPPIPDGAVLHAVHVSSYCFKQGRITVPPRVLFVACGFGDQTKINRWERVQQIRNTRTGKEGFFGNLGVKKDTRGLRGVLAGGWKKYEKEGLWDLPEFEERRKRGVEAFGRLRHDFEALRE